MSKGVPGVARDLQGVPRGPQGVPKGSPRGPKVARKACWKRFAEKLKNHEIHCKVLQKSGSGGFENDAIQPKIETKIVKNQKLTNAPSKIGTRAAKMAPGSSKMRSRGGRWGEGCLGGAWVVLGGWSQRIDTTTPAPSIPTL